MITSWQVGNSKAHFKRNKCFQGRSVPCSPILHFPLSASTKWLTWSQKSFLEACPQSLGWLSFKATQGCLSLPDGYLFSDSAALGLFTLFRLFKDSEKDGCIFLFKSWETLHTFLSILRRKKKKKSSYQGHLATEDIKHLWVFPTNLKICPLHTHLSPLSQQIIQNGERSSQNIQNIFSHLYLPITMLSIYKWPQNSQTYFLKGFTLLMGASKSSQNELEN